MLHVEVGDALLRIDAAQHRDAIGVGRCYVEGAIGVYCYFAHSVIDGAAALPLLV